MCTPSARPSLHEYTCAPPPRLSPPTFQVLDASALKATDTVVVRGLEVANDGWDLAPLPDQAGETDETRADEVCRVRSRAPGATPGCKEGDHARKGGAWRCGRRPAQTPRHRPPWPRFFFSRLPPTAAPPLRPRARFP